MNRLKERSGIALGIITLIIHVYISVFTQSGIIYFYEKYIFTGIRILYDYSIGLLPFASIYILSFVLIYYLFRFIKIIYKLKKGQYSKFLLIFFWKAFNFLGWIGFLFYFLWGFNYYRTSLVNSLKLPDVKMDSTTIVDEFIITTGLINELKSKLIQDSSIIRFKKNDITFIENELRESQEKIFSTWGINTSGRVRVRAIYPKGVLLRFSTAGIYIPFVNEGHIDAGLHQIQWPFTMAHEMAHGYGITDEGECNFIGLLTCIKTKDIFIQYSGMLSYWRYLFYEVNKRYPEVSKNVYQNVNIEIKNDLENIRKNLKMYPDIMPKIRDLIYDSYLKTHGVTEGLNSYNDIIISYLRWKKSERKL